MFVIFKKAIVLHSNLDRRFHRFTGAGPGIFDIVHVHVCNLVHVCNFTIGNILRLKMKGWPNCKCK